MTNFIPIFPLEIVVYPGESLNLHIFEPRYKQLIHDCWAQQKLFGIPYKRASGDLEWGTAMQITEIAKEYSNGEMDIKTKGTDAFKILELVKDLPDKQYMGAIVSYPENIKENTDSRIATLIESEVKKLYELLSVEEKMPHRGENLTAYEMAHFIGLSKEEEYELLTLMQEVQRLEFLRRHLSKLAPVLQELKEVKKRIQQNGHFKHLS